MDYKRFHLLEKAQVVVTAGGLLAAVYFLLGSYFRPADPLGPIALLPGNAFGKLLLAAALLLILSALAGATTTQSRPEGGVLSALIALGGLSLLSEPVGALLWSYPGPRGQLYGQMIVDVLFFTAVLVVAEMLAAWVRWALAKLCPRWVWSNPLDRLSDEQRSTLEKAQVDLRWDGSALRGNSVSLPRDVRNTLVGSVLVWVAHRRDPQAGAMGSRLRRGAACLATGAVTGMILVSVFMQSTERGQILFSLFAGFALAALLAQHLFPTRAMFVAWLMPMVVAGIVYTLAAISHGRGRPQYEVLPIDWLTAGCSGALLGFWIAGRMRESHVFDTLAQADSESVRLAP